MSEKNTPIEDFIEQAFEDNYQILRTESSRSLTPDGKQAALREVLLYWRKMRRVAEKVTETEVKLTLSGQESPAKHRFSIHGVVDIVRDNERTCMYDIKTHEVAYVHAHPELYQEQLNVYAHIWQELRRRQLDETAIIATRYPPAVAEALESGDEARLQAALDAWEPLVAFDFDESQISDTIAAFGQVVDAIEAGRFAPRSLQDLEEKIYGNETFATRTCRNCDARFSCRTYRRYLQQASTGRDAAAYRRYINDPGPEQDLDLWRSANLDGLPAASDLRQDYKD